MPTHRLTFLLVAAAFVAPSLHAQSASVSVSLQRPDPSQPASGAQLDYNIFANNEGPADAANVVLNTAVPTGAMFVSLTIPAGWSCPTLPPAGGTGAIQCTTALLVPGTGTFFLSITTPPDTPAGTVIQLDANISSTTADPDANDNQDSLTLTLAWQSLLSVQKNGPATAASGAVLTYAIPITNSGPSFAANLTVTDVLPPELTLVSASGAGWSCTGGSTVTCTLAQLGLTTSTLTLQASTSPSFAGGTVTNAVSLTATSDSSTRTASATTVVTPSADITITKSAAPTSSVAGQDLVYTVTLTNNGPSNAASATMTDALPAQVLFLSLTAPAGWSCSTPAVNSTGTINCSIAVITLGPAQFTIQTHVPPNTPLGTQITNSASVSSTTPDPTTPNSATVSGSVTTQSDLALVSIADTPDPVVAGTSLTYTVTLTNNGPSDATGASLSVPLPSSLSFSSIAAPAGWNCTTPPVGATGTVTCTIATLAVAAPATFTLATLVAPSTPNGSTIATTATTTSSFEIVPGNDSATATTTVVWQSLLSIGKNGPATAASGQVLTYTIPIMNSGPSFAANMTMTDVLPPELTFVSASGAGWSCTGGSTVTCTLAQLGLTTSTLTLQASTAPSFAGGAVTNAVSLTATSDSSTRTASTTTQVTPSADITITKSAAPTLPVAGQDLVYMVTLTNNGPSNAANGTMSDPLPAQVQFLSIAVPAGWSCSTPAVNSTGTINCSIAAFPIGPAQFTIQTHVPPNTPLGTQITNSASAASTTADPTTPNNAAVSGSVTTPSDVALVTIAGVPAPVIAGTALTYTITLTNNGPSDATGASLSVPLPSSLSFTSIAAPAGWSCTTPPVGATGTLSCTTPSLAVAAPATFTLATLVAPSTPGGSSITTTATATSSSDVVPGNDSATATTTVSSPAILSGTKTASGRLLETLPVTYTIVIMNSGVAVQGNNPGNEMIDVLPSSLALVSASATSGAAAANVATNTVTWNGAIPPGGSVTVTIVATIQMGTAGTPIANAATINFDADGNGLNESMSTAGPVTFTPGAAANIPTLSFLALFGLALALACAALARLSGS